MKNGRRRERPKAGRTEVLCWLVGLTIAAAVVAANILNIAGVMTVSQRLFNTVTFSAAFTSGWILAEAVKCRRRRVRD